MQGKTCSEDSWLMFVFDNALKFMSGEGSSVNPRIMLLVG